MKKTILSIITMALTLNAAAQDYSDAANFFDNKAWGWATCTDDAGSPYTLNGGMGAEQPKTIILKSNGGDNASAITAAINAYDIIVLDGSNGVFTINAQMKIDNAKNKTIVGRNNAELATKFFLTQEDITYLKSQGLDKYSSTDQYTGTLPNGETVTCDKRAFFTKKAMMELEYQKSGQYTLPNKAGIFQFNVTCENVIVRNLTLRGPGAVDIDGVDLLYDAYAKHLWVDHCTFIDSQDGALDTRGSYNTYTWNHFYYTDRSYSHAYTCGQGWVDNHKDVLHITWGYNMWGAGCNRRLPQCDDSYIHLVNNYHNCPGNSVGMTLNSYVKGLVEGNYAAKGVNSPLTGSGANRNITVVDNSFSYSNVGPTVTVPYTYSKISYKDVPTVLTAKHGAGATLDKYMPGENQTLSEETFGFLSSSANTTVGGLLGASVKNYLGVYYTLSSDNEQVASINAEGQIVGKGVGTANITATINDEYYGTYTTTMEVKVSSGSEFGTVKKWDFKRGEATEKALANDGDWSGAPNYIYSPALNNEALSVDGEEPAETEGLRFTSIAEKLQWYPDRLRFNKENSLLTIPAKLVKAGDKIIIKWKSANATSQRGFNCGNATPTSLLTDGNVAEKEISVLDAADVTLTVTGGIYVYSIELQRMGYDAVNQVSSQAPQPSALRSYRNVIGQEVAPTAKGIVIVNGQKFYNK